MPSNPITPQEQYDILVNRSLTPRDGVTTDTYMAAGYILMPPATVDGPVKWRLFDAAYVQTGIIDPNRLGTGATGAGNLYLADDGTWKTISVGGGGDMLKATYDVDNDGVVDSAETTQIIVRNSTGSTLTKGQVVYLSGATGNRPNAVLSKADTEATSSKTIGIVVANIANNSDGYVAVSGTLHNLDTSAFADGDALWLSATTAGAYTSTIPAEPNHTVFIGYVARSHPTQGRLIILIQNGYELNELHGVLISAEANNDLLVYESSSTLWKNKSISTIFGGTPLITVPTLDQVTTAGNTTTNAITVNKLTITGAGETYNMVVGSASDVTNWNQFISSEGTGEYGIWNDSFYFQPLSTLANGIRFYTSAGVAALNVFQTSNIGINTTTDAGYKLDVNGDIRSQGVIRLINPAYINGGYIAHTANSTLVLGGGPLGGENITIGPSNRIFIFAQQSRFTGGSVQIASTLTLGNSGNASVNSMLLMQGSITAGSALGRGIGMETTLIAAANNDVLIGLDVNPTFTNGAFTGVTNIAARFGGNVLFTEGARTISIAAPAATGNGGALTISAGNATTAGQGGNISIQPGNGAGGPGAGTVIISNTSWWNGATVNGTLTVTNSGPNTGTSLQVNAGGQNGLTIYWDNLTPFMQYGLVSARQARFVNSSSYSFSNNLLVGTTTDSGYKLDIAGTARIAQSTAGTKFTVTGIDQEDILLVNWGGTNSIGLGSNTANNPVLRLGVIRFTAHPNGGRLQLSGATGRFGTDTELKLYGSVSGTATGTMVWLGSNSDFSAAAHNPTSGTLNVVGVLQSAGTNYAAWNPSSGNATFNIFNVNPVLNTSGTYAGIVRGFYYNPTLTSTTGVTHRAIETVTGDVLLGTTSGNVAIGTSTLGTATELTLGGSQTASSAIARGQLLNTTLVPSSSGDILNALEIAPTFSVGAGTLLNYSNWIRLTGNYNPSVYTTNNYAVGIDLSNGYYNTFSAVGIWLRPTISNVQNAYGIVIDNAQGWAIYQSSASVSSYFRGTTYLGDVTQGSLNFSGNNATLNVANGVNGGIKIGYYGNSEHLILSHSQAGATFSSIRNTYNNASSTMLIDVAGQNNLRLWGTGNVVVGGTTDAGFKLDVNGTIRAQGKLTISTGGTEITGTIVGYSGLQVYGTTQIFSGNAFQIFNAANNSKASFQYINANGLLLTTNSDNISGVLKGLQLNPTMVASANNDVLVGLDINPTFTNGAFTGVYNVDLRTKNAGVVIGSGYGYGALYGYANDGIVQVVDGGTSALSGNAYATQIWLRPAGNAGGGNSNYWATIEHSFGGLFIQSARYASNIVIKTGRAGTSGNIYLNNAGGTMAMLFGATSNVTIGTTTDSGYKLDVNGTARTSQLHTFSQGTYLDALSTNYFYTADTGGSTYGGLALKNSTQDYSALIYTGRSGASNSIVFEHLTYSGTPTAQGSQKFSLTGTTFGVGNNSAYGHTLTIHQRSGGVATYPLVITNQINTTNSGVGILMQTADSTSAVIVNHASIVSWKQNLTSPNVTSDMRFSTISDAANTLSEKMRISSAGNLLVGTTTDSGYKLDVSGVVMVQKTSGSTLYINETGGNVGDVANLYLIGNNMGWGASLRYNVGAGGANNRLDFYTGASRRMSIAADTGNILINTITDAGYKLDINGTARVQGALTATLANVATANVIYYNSSTGLLTYGTAPIGAQFVIDYDYNIVGLKNGINLVFTTTANFQLTTTRVFLNGQRLTRGAGYDYVETGTNQITFTNAPTPTDLIIIEYQI